MVNVPRLKGIHLAMHSGMCAAEAIIEALKRGSAEDLTGYQQRIETSAIASDLYRSPNMRQPFTRGFAAGAAIANLMELPGGRVPAGRWPTENDAGVGVFIGNRDRRYPGPDRKLTFDKLGSVFPSGNATRDDALNHIRIERTVSLAVGLMWHHMCPAGVYNVPEEALERLSSDQREPPSRLVDVHVIPSNCIQCGAITAKGGRLTPPEGGDGPNYQIT